MQQFLLNTLEYAAILFIFMVGLGVFVLAIFYVVDVRQTEHAIRRNYPVIGRFRYLFGRLGEFFRQYFFSMDREEMPFNRAQRSWVYRAAKNVDNTVPFGSSKNIRQAGTILFVNNPYPTLEEDAVAPETLEIGSHTAHPYAAKSIINISGMSYGAISRPAVTALSKGAKMAGIWMNTGEGGLSPYHLAGGADIVFQVGTAKYGVRDKSGALSDQLLRRIAKHTQVKMFELKLSQGAKPGKGGILPGEKVTSEIAQIRGIQIGEASISPNRHHEISNNVELLDMLDRLHTVTDKPVGFKTVIASYSWLDSLFSEINKRGVHSAPDFITVDGSNGGTGAAPMPLIDDMGLPLNESLPMLIDKLIAHGLRDRIKVICSGKLITPMDVGWALCMGADFVVSARGFMFSLGCIQALKCNKNTCPTGIATHNIKLQHGLDIADKANRVMHYAQNMNKEICIIAHSCGVPSPRQLRRHHARMVTNNGLSIGLDELHPPAEILQAAS